MADAKRRVSDDTACMLDVRPDTDRHAGPPRATLGGFAFKAGYVPGDVAARARKRTEKFAREQALAAAGEGFDHVAAVHAPSSAAMLWRGNSSATGMRCPRTVSCASRIRRGASWPSITTT